MPSRSGIHSILIAAALCAGALIAGRALADEAPPPPPPPGAPTSGFTERVIIGVDKDGKAVDLGAVPIDGRRVVLIDHDGDGQIDAATDDIMGPGDGRRDVIIMRDIGPEGLRMPGMGMDGPRPPGRGMHGPGGYRGPERLKRMTRELGLTPEQRTKARGLMEASRPKMEELRGQILAQRVKMRETDPDAKGYDALVASTAKRIGELTAQREQQRAQLQRQMWQLLTPEQRAKAEAKKAEAKKRRTEQADRMERRARELRGTP
ncbi:MAG: Spy/CpxP family protein refolding chaperone [Gammaproteobacteria bacterium]